MEPEDSLFTWFAQRTDFISPISKQIVYLPVFLYSKFTLASPYLFCLLLLIFLLTLYLIPFPYSLGHIKGLFSASFHIFLKPGAGVGVGEVGVAGHHTHLNHIYLANQPQPAIHAGRWGPKQKGPSDQVELYLSFSWLLENFSSFWQTFRDLNNSAYIGYRLLYKHLALLWEQSKDGTMQNSSQTNQWQRCFKYFRARMWEALAITVTLVCVCVCDSVVSDSLWPHVL